MADSIKYTVEHSTTGEVLLEFIADGNVDGYSPSYRALAELADTGQTFSQEIDGTMYSGITVFSEPYNRLQPSKST